MEQKKQNFKETNLLDLPDEILEDKVMQYLTFNDLSNLANVGDRRLKCCALKVAEKKPFSKIFLSKSLYHVFL